MNELNKNNVDALLKYYESARQEILSRISSRDNSLLLYLGGVGAIMSVAFDKDIFFLLIIPFLALGIAPIIAHHHAMIGGLVLYCSKELTPYFIKYGIEIASWDTSRTRIDFVTKTIRLRYLGDTALVCIPAIVSILANSYNLEKSSDYCIWFAGVVCVILSIVIMLKSLRFRQKLFSQMKVEMQSLSNSETKE